MKAIIPLALRQHLPRVKLRSILSLLRAVSTDDTGFGIQVFILEHRLETWIQAKRLRKAVQKLRSNK